MHNHRVHGVTCNVGDEAEGAARAGRGGLGRPSRRTRRSPPQFVWRGRAGVRRRVRPERPELGLFLRSILRSRQHVAPCDGAVAPLFIGYQRYNGCYRSFKRTWGRHKKDSQKHAKKTKPEGSSLLPSFPSVKKPVGKNRTKSHQIKVDRTGSNRNRTFFKFPGVGRPPQIGLIRRRGDRSLGGL